MEFIYNNYSSQFESSDHVTFQVKIRLSDAPTQAYYYQVYYWLQPAKTSDSGDHPSLLHHSILYCLVHPGPTKWSKYETDSITMC